MSYKPFHWIAGLLIVIFVLAAYNIPVEGASRRSQARAMAASSLRVGVTPQNTAAA